MMLICEILNTRVRPTHVSHPVVGALCEQMRLCGREDLAHYAGASYRDEVAWQFCLAWQSDLAAPEAVLKERALRAAGLVR